MREAARCWVGTLPLMQACGLAGRPNALVGLDLLRGDGRRTVVLDFDESKLWVERGADGQGLVTYPFSTHLLRTYIAFDRLIGH